MNVIEIEKPPQDEVGLPIIGSLIRDQVLTLMNCRGLKQYTGMIRDYENGKCPFCDPLDTKNVIINQNEQWRMWVNPFPLKSTTLHLIMAHQRHLTSIDDITDDDFTAAGKLFVWARKEFNIMGGCFAMRMGSPEFNAGSVLHLHNNIIVPDGTGAVQVTLAKEPEKVRDTIARMHAFEKLRRGQTIETLTDEEKELVKGRLD